jgi:P4 family phage/plasmid primase-like protien
VTERNEQRQQILSALHEYVDLGLPIIPVCSHDHMGYSERHISRCNQAGKIPLIKGWQTHETTDIQQVRTWIKEFKRINIGLPLGHVSGYVGVDVDGELGETMLDEMSDGDLPETWEYITGAGRRLLYSIPVGMKTKKHVNTGEGEHQECSILAFGQQTVLPPSIHHTGRVYEWVEGRSPEDLDCALAPDWLLDLVRVDTSKPGTIDLTNPDASYQKPEPKKEVGPMLITDTTLPSEFIEFESLDLDLTIPDTSYTGKKAKTQEKEEVGPELLEQVVSSGGRDNHMTKVVGYLCAKNRNLGKEGILLLARSINVMKMQPPLDEAAVEAKVNHFWETEQMKSAHYKNQSAEGKDRKQFEAYQMAQTVLNVLEEDGYVLKADQASNAIWMTKKTAGPWKQYYVGGAAEDFQLFIIDVISQDKYGGDPKWTTRKHYGEVANNLLLLLKKQGRVWLINNEDVDTQKIGAHKLIPLKDGKLLNWRTGELLPWDPESHFTYVLPIDYNPEAECPNWEKRLAEWLPDESARMVIQEYVGYSFIPYMGIEMALWIKGEGANGKSLFLDTIQKMLGRDVCSSATMSFLFSRFGKKPLLGKIMNIVHEAGADYLKGGNADDFKNMVSGGTITADVKNKEPIVFNNTAKFIFSANHDIGTTDKSNAWRRRILLIPFNQDFRNSNESKSSILTPIHEEFSGIFNWAIEGLKRLAANNETFTRSEAIEQEVQRYISKNDVAADFFDNCLLVQPELNVDGVVVEKGVASSAVVDLFKLWTEYRGATLKKHDQRIREYLEKSQNLKYARKATPNLYLTTAKKTSCWVHAKVYVTDPDFLEWAIDSGSILMTPNTLLQEYIKKRLDEINDMPTPASRVTEMPDTKASSK